MLLQKYHDKSRDVRLSKALSYFLRHGPKSGGPQLMNGGYLYVDDVLRQQGLQQYTEADVRRVVEENDKQRFQLDVDAESSRLKIRANQGHTVEVTDLELTQITDARDTPIIIHGTSKKAWETIQREGLSRMKRNHIHFAPGEPGGGQVISGMRKDCEVLIHVDIEKALADGVSFFRSANNVILCPGDDRGFLRPQYFKAVFQRRPRVQLL